MYIFEIRIDFNARLNKCFTPFSSTPQHFKSAVTLCVAHAWTAPDIRNQRILKLIATQQICMCICSVEPSDASE